MTNQDAFTLMVQHLRTQGGPSKDIKKGIGCVYRHPDGIKRCAVGVLIPDTEYKYSFEGNTISHIYEMVPSLKSVEVSLLRHMQDAHDKEERMCQLEGLSWLEYMEQRYLVIAEWFGLTVPLHPCAEPQVSAIQQCESIEA